MELEESEAVETLDAPCTFAHPRLGDVGLSGDMGG